MMTTDDCILRWEPALRSYLVYSPKSKQLKVVDSAREQATPPETAMLLAPGTLSAPLKLFVGTTRACDLDCSFCFARGRRYGPSMSTDAIASTIRQAAAMSVFEVRLTGGEPTVHPDFFGLVAAIDRLGMNCSLNTHGAFRQPLLDKLIDSPVDDIRISIDGPEGIHDTLRGRGAFRRASHAAQELKAAGKTVRLNTMVFKGNADVLDAVLDIAQRLGLSVRFCPMRAIGRAREAGFAETHVLSAAEWHRVEDDLAARGLFRKNVSCFSIDDLEDFSRCPGMTAGLEESHCSPWVTQMGVDPEGEAYAGGRIDDIDKSLSVGSVIETPLAELWRLALCDVAERVLPRFPRCTQCSPLRMWEAWTEQLAHSPTQSRHLY